MSNILFVVFAFFAVRVCVAGVVVLLLFSRLVVLRCTSSNSISVPCLLLMVVSCALVC